MKKILALLITVCLFSVSFLEIIPVNATESDTALTNPLVLPEIIGRKEAEEYGYAARLKDREENLNTLVFSTNTGNHVMKIYGFPVKYVNSNGEIEDISTDIVRLSDGRYQTSKNSIITTFSRNLSDGVSLQSEDLQITMVPAIVQSDKAINSIIVAKDTKTVVYSYDEYTNIEYRLTYTGIKEEIVVSQYTGQTQYNFLVKTNGLVLQKREGTWCFLDEDDLIRATLGDIVVFTADEKNNAYGEIKVTAVKPGQIYTITIEVDAEFLSDKKTKYPIRIDPTVEVNYSQNGNGAIQDVTLNSWDTSEGLSGSIYVGPRSTYGIARILMRFPGLNITTLPQSEHIVSASVELRDLMCESETLTVECRIFDGNEWSETTASWNTVSADDYSALLSQNIISYSNGIQQDEEHRYVFDITSAVQWWKNGTFNPLKGIMFKAPTSVETSGTYISKSIASYNRSEYRPSLTVVYRDLISQGTIATVPNIRSKYLPAGQTQVFTFTPPENATYSIWTTGSTDTQIGLYGDAYLSTLLTNNEDGGQGYNACITYSCMAARTYYIAVQGFSTITTGNYTLNVYKGFPLSGSEQPKNFSQFNGVYRQYNNCYTYALNIWVHPETGTPFRQNGQRPGELSGSPIPAAAWATVSNARSMIPAAVKRDLISLGGTAQDFVAISQNAMPPIGYYKVALYVAPGEDFHWVRQTSNFDGRWAHKLASLSATDVDDNGDLIFVPSAAHLQGFTVNGYTLVGYYALKPPVHSAITTNVLALNDGQVVTSAKYNISVKQFKEFEVGVTTRQDVENKVGGCHSIRGSGYIGEVYGTCENKVVVIYYDCDEKVEKITYLDKNDI